MTGQDSNIRAPALRPAAGEGEIVWLRAVADAARAHVSEVRYITMEEREAARTGSNRPSEEFKNITGNVLASALAAPKPPQSPAFRDMLGYPWLPCPICKGVEGCDHTVLERSRGIEQTDHPQSPSLALAEDNRRLREALAWYASEIEPKTFKICEWNGGFISDMSEWGDRARAALSTPSPHPHSQREEAFGEMLAALHEHHTNLWAHVAGNSPDKCSLCSLIRKAEACQ